MEAINGMKNNDPRTHKGLHLAQTAYEKAAEQLVKKTKQSYPIGRRIAVTLGRARIIGEIVSAGGHAWSNPGEVEIVNIATGKRRHFNGPDPHGFYNPQFVGT